MKSYKTIKQRIKDKHINALLSLSREVNFVFNFVNNLSYEHTRRTGKFFSAFDLATQEELSGLKQNIRFIQYAECHRK